MKTLVVYYSNTGNTEKVAQAIHQAIAGSKEIRRVDQVENLEGFDLIFCGFPIHDQSVPASVEKFIRKLPASKMVAFFATHGSLTGSRMTVGAFEHAFSLAAKIKVIGSFSCRGKIPEQYMEELQKRPDHQGWIDVIDSAESHPDKSDLEDAAMFAKLMVYRAEVRLGR